MTTVVIQPDGTAGIDTHIREFNPTSNFGTSATMSLGLDASSGAVRRGLIKFDLSSIPAGSTIVSAILSLSCSSEVDPIDTNLAVHRSLVEWFETLSTWNARDSSGPTAWGSAPGGSSGSEWFASATDTTSITGTSIFFDWDVTADVQDFVNGTFTNYGWWLLNLESGGTTTLKTFDTSENATAANRPKLTVNYLLPGEVSVDIQPNAAAGFDTFLDSSTPTTNYGTNTAIQIGDVQSAGTQNTRTLIKFDLSSVPIDAVITHTVLSLFENAASGSGTWEVQVQRLLRDWVEGQATWNEYSTGNSWATAGAGADGTDRSATISATLTADGVNNNAFVEFTSATLTDDVIKMHNGTYNNYGWVIHAPTAETVNPARRTIWASSDHATAAQHPKLTVYYINENIEASSGGSSTGVAVIFAQGYMEAAVAGTSTAEAFIQQPGARVVLMDGTSDMEVDLSASANLIAPFVGTSDMAATIHGDIAIPPVTMDGEATVSSTLVAQGYMSTTMSGTSTLSAEGTFQGQLRMEISGTSTFSALGWSKATGKKRAERCESDPLLYITDGTYLSNGQLNRLNLIDPSNGFSLYDWRPNIAQYKNAGYWSDSALGQGRRLSRRVFANAIEIMTLKAKSYDQNLLIAFTREYFGWQEAAADYWTSEWAVLPIYLVARSPRETQTRYATIHTMSIPELENPYGQPFFGKGKPSFENITLRIERDDWTHQPPGEFEGVAISGVRSWTVAGWVTGS